MKVWRQNLEQQRLTQTIRIVMNVLQGHSLGTDMAAAEGVPGIPFDTENVALVVGDPQSTHGLTQVTGSQMGLRFGHEQSLLQFGGDMTR